MVDRIESWSETIEFISSLTAVVSKVELEVKWSSEVGSLPHVRRVRYSSILLWSTGSSFSLVTGFAWACLAEVGGTKPGGIMDMVFVVLMRRTNSLSMEVRHLASSGPRICAS